MSTKMDPDYTVQIPPLTSLWPHYVSDHPNEHPSFESFTYEHMVISVGIVRFITENLEKTNDKSDTIDVEEVLRRYLQFCINQGIAVGSWFPLMTHFQSALGLVEDDCWQYKRWKVDKSLDVRLPKIVESNDECSLPNNRMSTTVQQPVNRRKKRANRRRG